MFLLIQKTGSATITATYLFTFHDVSINTMYQTDLTSRIHLPLHSTMFLLIHITMKQIELDDLYFTFHDVSINTGVTSRTDFLKHPLHSTMFLLILRQISFFYHPDIPLHSTMFLLIPAGRSFIRQSSSLYIPRCFY